MLPLLSTRFDNALAYAARIHRNQLRKGTKTPYVSHLLAVAGIVLENGGTEDEAIAALLHDAAEDQGGCLRLHDIRVRFGERVAEIVKACSDALEPDPTKKPPWKVRKERYHEHLRASADASVYLVSAADKLHNARATLGDAIECGDRVWRRFEVGRDETLWNYDRLVALYESGPRDVRRIPIVRRLKQIVEQLRGF